MKKEYSNIEDLFKDSFNGYKVDPSPSTWKGINGKLNLKQFLSPGFKNFNVYYLSAIVGIVSLAGVLLFDNKKETTLTTLNTPEKSELIIPNKKPIEKTEPIINTPTKIEETKVTSLSTKIKEKQNSQIAESSRVFEVIPLQESKKIEKLSDNSVKNSADGIDKIAVAPPKPLFEVDKKKGCAPFEINLNNYTKLAQKYEWNFGDGGKSNIQNPRYVYRYPGVYKIKLKATGIGGIAYSLIDSIVVYENVMNKITSSFDKELTEGELFALSVKTNQKADYEWSFGDGTYSNEQNPTHTYEKEGFYSISLITLTEMNCYDSVKVADAFVVKSNKKIVFPNAFCPNLNGPSEGKYYKNNYYNDIFHPRVKGVLKDYNLKIFAKSGMLIFESKNVKIGWDGYFQNRLMPAGVYPFVVTATFEGEDKPVQKRGNITVIHKK